MTRTQFARIVIALAVLGFATHFGALALRVPAASWWWSAEPFLLMAAFFAALGRRAWLDRRTSAPSNEEL
jgi:hypothetical protein